MAEFSQLSPDNGVTVYDVKDATARSLIAGKSTVSYTPTLTSGTAIGDLTIDGSTETLYAPTGGGGSVTTWYGTSSTASATAAKEVTCTGYSLSAGALIGVFFSLASTAATPTLNVNSTGAKTIYVGGATPSSTANTLKWSAGTYILFQYDGTYYRYIYSRSQASLNSPDGSGSWYGTSSTAATTAAKTSTITNYRLTPGAMVTVYFSTASTVAGAITLNVNSTGAKTIYVNGAATSATNVFTWPVKTTLTFIYTGSYYYLVSSTDVQPKLESGTNIKTINGQSVLGSGDLTVSAVTDFIVATSTSANSSMTSGTMTQVDLNEEDGNPISTEVSGGGVLINEDGWYSVSGQAYFNAVAAATGKGVYIFAGSDFATATEQFGTVYPKPTTAASASALPVGPMFLWLTAGTTVFLVARSVGGTGTLYHSNASTFLCVERKF